MGSKQQLAPAFIRVLRLEWPQGAQLQVSFKDQMKSIVERKFSSLFVSLGSEINTEKNKNFQKKTQIDLTWLQFWRYGKYILPWASTCFPTEIPIFAVGFKKQMGGAKGWESKIHKRIGMLYVWPIWDKINTSSNNETSHCIYGPTRRHLKMYSQVCIKEFMQIKT